MLAVVVTGCHGQTKYQWSKGDSICEDDVYPLMFPEERGQYSCTCSIKAETGSSPACEVKLMFRVREGVLIATS